MKKALLIAAVVMFVASSAFAVLPIRGYIGIFKDATHYVGDCCNYLNPGNTVCPAEFGVFRCWIWCLPSAHGLHAAEFAVYFPPTIYASETTRNPGITFELGTLATGISVEFDADMCQLDWVWLYQLKLLNLAPITPWNIPGYTYPPLPPPGSPAMYIAIIPHPGTLPVPAYRFANCEPGYPIETIINLTPLWLCPDPAPQVLGVQETSWGAIKSLF